MLNNYFILKAEAEFLNKELRDSVLTESLILGKNLVALIFEPLSPKILKFHLEKNLESLYLYDTISIPKKNVLKIFPSIVNASVVNVNIAERNRIISISFNNNYSLVFYAIPNKSNLIIVKDGIIEDCYTGKSEYQGKEFNSIIPKPAVSGRNIETIKDKYNYFGRIYLEELENRIKSDPETDISLAAEDLESEISYSFAFTIYSREDNLIPSQIELSKYSSWEKEVYGSINTLIHNYYKRFKYLKEKNQTKTGLISKVDSDIKRISTKIFNLENAVKEAGSSELFKIFGDILLMNLNDIPQGSKAFEYKDNEGKSQSIRLNPGLTVQANANHYYTKYKGLKNSVESLKNKINILKKECDLLISHKRNLEQEENFKVLKKMDNSDLKKEETEKLPFRIFKLSDKFEVWVGKDSASNDLLTMKYTNQYDYWFHVRGFSGSHTTLKLLDKNLKPEKDVIIKTASIAAYYSKARNGKHIPVAYTEKKYVKKRKGFKQGSVVMEKEKIVFVNPSIPET